MEFIKLATPESAIRDLIDYFDDVSPHDLSGDERAIVATKIRFWFKLAYLKGQHDIADRLNKRQVHGSAGLRHATAAQRADAFLWSIGK